MVGRLGRTEGGSLTPAATTATSKSSVSGLAVRMERMIIPAVALLTVGSATEQERWHTQEAAAPNRLEGVVDTRPPPAGPWPRAPGQPPWCPNDLGAGQSGRLALGAPGPGLGWPVTARRRRSAGSPRRHGPLPGSHPPGREEAAQRPATSWWETGRGSPVTAPQLQPLTGGRERTEPNCSAPVAPPAMKSGRDLSPGLRCGSHPQREAMAGDHARGREGKVSFPAPALPTQGGYCSPRLSQAAGACAPPPPRRGGARGGAGGGCLRAGAWRERGGRRRSPRADGGTDAQRGELGALLGARTPPPPRAPAPPRAPPRPRASPGRHLRRCESERGGPSWLLRGGGRAGGARSEAPAQPDRGALPCPQPLLSPQPPPARHTSLRRLETSVRVRVRAGSLSLVGVRALCPRLGHCRVPQTLGWRECECHCHLRTGSPACSSL
ncbi:basic salivary proline-rich protein 3-like [Cavia porcellus]|uniref:basic salivary proline-rich protein 3-like n=1 Tax=Cavia porcellus TaxID=10141 RepID=UPI002FE2629F